MNPHECINYCNKLLQRGQEIFLAVSLKARVLNFISGYEQARQFIKPYLDQNPNNDSLWVIFAEIHEYHDNRSAAISALQKAKQILEKENKQNNEENLNFLKIKLEQLIN